MDQNVAQWLAEVQSLQQQVSELQKDREQAYSSAENWRKLYESEAQQRRRDVEVSSQKIEKLQQEINNLMAEKGQDLPMTDPEIVHKTKGLPRRTAKELYGMLLASQEQCEQLKTAVDNEKAEHKKTRDSLTAALSDAVDLLAKERLAASKASDEDSGE
ncbi:MAG: hypothetical protein AAFR58_02360 [Cyanobacteria bacterium J06627_28]